MVNFKKVGDSICLKVILGYRNLSCLQQESLDEEGFFKEDFPCPDSEQFFAFEGTISSEHKHCIPVTRFSCLYGSYEYHIPINGWWYGVNFVKDYVYLQQIEVSKC